MLPDSKDPYVNPKDLQGIKKPPLHFIPPAALVHEAMAFLDGAAKYGPYNWRTRKVRAMVYIGAALRHIEDYLDRDDFAEDSGVHSLGHARACLGVLLDADATGNLVDDRPPKGAITKLFKFYKDVITTLVGRWQKRINDDE